MAIGGQQPLERAAEVVAADGGSEQGESGCPDLGPDLLGGVPVGHAIPVGDVGHDPLNWEVFGWI